MLHRIIINPKLFVLLALVLTACFSAQAQTKDEKQVLTALEVLRKGMIDGDRTVLEGIAAPTLSYGHSGGALDTKKDFVEKIASGASDFVTIDITDQTVAVTGKTAIVRHTLSAATNDGGKPGTVKIKVLLVWQKMGGKWKLLARQAVRPPAS